MNRQVIRAVAAAVLVATALAGCGSGSGTTSSSTLRVGAFTPLVSGFDPSVAQANQLTYLEAVYDTLIRQNPDGSLAPGLATSWAYTAPTQLVLHLRTGVRFTDGEAFDATAVVANLKRNQAAGSALATHLSSITALAAPDAATVQITTSAPTTSLLATLADITGMMAAPRAFAKLTTAPVGTGPWVYQSSKSSAGASYFFSKNPQYWDTTHRPAKDLEIKVVQNYTAQLNAVQSGQLDLTPVQATQVAQAKSAGLTVSSVPGARLYLLVLDRLGQKVPALGHAEVRQAMNYAIDRAGLINTLSPGEGVASAGFWVPGYWPSDPQAQAMYGHDTTRAKQLLAQAGFPNGFSVALATIPVFQPWAEAIQAQFKQIGITLQLHVLQNGVLAKTIRANTYPLILTTGGGTSNGDPATEVQQLLLPDSPNNPEHYENPQITALAAQGESLTAQAQRQPIYRMIDRLATASAVNVVIGYESAIVVSRKGITGVEVVPCGGAACVSLTGVRDQ